MGVSGMPFCHTQNAHARNAGFSPEILRGGKSLDVYADASILQSLH